jgi:hypothetical protein
MMMVSPPALAPLHNAVVESFFARLKRELFAPTFDPAGSPKRDL